MWFNKVSSKKKISKETNNEYKNKINKLIDKSKNDYYLNCFDRFKSSMRKSWELIRELMGNPSKLSKSLVSGDESFSSLNLKAETFNNYFSDIGNILDSELPPPIDSPLDFMSDRNTSSFYLFPVTTNEISSIISKLKLVKCDIDSMPVRIFIKLKHLLVSPLADLINISFRTGKFPHKLKLARITPILKKGDPSDPSNFRPISCLPFIGKVFEKAMCNRLVSFCSKFSIISNSQFGFQKSLSTVDALIHLTENIYKSLDNRQHNITILVDLKKAFDTVNHVYLLKKLEHYGIRGFPLDWFRSYLSNRRCFVELNSIKSSEKNINTGVPQGSTLSSILFLIYINDLPKISNNFQTTLFADDTTISISDSNLQTLISHTNDNIARVLNWTISNRLSVNSAKTEMLLFTNRNVDRNAGPVVFGNDTLDFKPSCVFLGTSLDHNLKFSDHINKIVAKISKHAGILFKIRDKLPTEVRIRYYYAFVYPFISYGVSVWGGTYRNHINPLIIQHKRIIRIMTNSNNREHTTPLFHRLGLLKFEDVHKYSVLVKMYKMISDGKFLITHDVNTRNRTCAAPTFHRLSKSQHAFSYLGPTYWNSLPNYLKNVPTISSFKTNLKKYFLESYAPD